MTAGLPANVSYNRPASLNGQKEPLTMAAVQQRLGTSVLNTSRIELDPKYLAGLRNDQPAINTASALPKTGWPKLDNVVTKAGPAGTYAWLSALTLAGDSARGALMGSLGGLAVGLLGGGATHLAQKSWLLRYCLPVGAAIGTGLGMASGSSLAFVKSAIHLSRQVKDSLKQHYHSIKLAARNELT